MSEDDAISCLKQAICDAHEAVIIGSGVAGRRLGTRKHGDAARQKVHLHQLGRILPEIMDALIVKLTDSVAKVICAARPDDELDDDEFELRMTQLLRKVDDLCAQLGVTCFKEVFSSYEAEVSSRLYRYKFSAARIRTMLK